MKENEEKNTWISIELTTTVESGCGIPVSNKRKVSLEGLEIVVGLIRKDRTRPPMGSRYHVLPQGHFLATTGFLVGGYRLKTILSLIQEWL